jgi:hypothetical protein
MVAICTVAWLVAAAALGTQTGIEVLCGMLGPLAMACATWVLAERTWRLHPERLMSQLIAAFAGKMVFFGAYVAVMLRVLTLRPVPFVVSFTGAFIVLHLMEALGLRNLFADAAHTSR